MFVQVPSHRIVVNADSIDRFESAQHPLDSGNTEYVLSLRLKDNVTKGPRRLTLMKSNSFAKLDEAMETIVKLLQANASVVVLPWFKC